MHRRSVIASIGAIVGTSVGAAAYTSASVDRSASFTVAADSTSALIGLTAGTTNQITSDNTDTLTISVADLNTDGTFTFGDGNSLDTSHAFSIINNDSTDRSITVGYGTAGTQFDIYEIGSTDWSDATLVGTVDSATDQTLAATAGQEFRVVVKVDTTGIGSGSGALDGTLTFNAN